MSDSKLVFEYIRKSSTLASVANEYDNTPAAIVKSVMRFLKTHPESSYYERIRYKLKIELTKLFYASHSTAKDFAEKYGLSEFQFIVLIGEAIDDPSIVTSDALADKIYRKLLHNRNSLGVHTPKRNVRIIAEMYVSSQSVSQDSLAYSYNISRCSISSILNRGITKGILSKELAEMVACKSCYKQSKYITYATNFYSTQ